MEQLLNTEIWNGNTVGDYLTLDFLAGLAGDILAIILIVVLGFAISGWVRRRIIAVGESHRQLDDTLFHFLGDIARYIVLTFAALFVLNTFGIQTTSIVAVLGAAGLAIGLALQGTLSNVAAGVMIILFRPIKMGDFVEINDSVGTVKNISLNYTELANLSNVHVIVPNSEVWGNTIINYSVNPTRRAEWTFGVSYGSDLKKAEQVIRDTIMSDPRSHTDPEPFLQVNNLGDFSVDFLCRVWVNASDYFQYQADMKRKVKEALDDNGIEIPFPTRTVYEQPAD
ncbi:mechanosensitive ion channel family protein [Marivivens donghaensis]|uniref:Small-conductance mechanosensitive channel n=1 Tax=Marivivens donghaensis TaxID=1699413 RepID=A0ABX0VV37_9RHOB|nr:mechanosensitive ion channel family protein [Marivivens donghaensis]NIY71659.1 mechanosensitive ion channel family protein [Marivivens donghaensis]